MKAGYFWRIWAVLLVLSIFWLGWAIRTSPPVEAQAEAGVPDEIRAKSFVVVDDQGKTGARLALYADGAPGLDLLDAQGKIRAGFGTLADGSPVLACYDAQGRVLFSAP